jgi:hypothetical protein
MKWNFMTQTDIYDKAVMAIKAWGSLRPTKTFFRQSLEDFTKLVTPSAEAREEITELEARMRKALERRDQADKITRRAVIRIVNAVKGDPDEGEDGELIAAMGYLPHTARASLIGLARRNARKAAQKAGEAEEVKG